MAIARLTEQAEEDLDEIWAFIAADKISAADRLVKTLLETMQSLADFPGMGRSRDELRQGLRSFPVGNYTGALPAGR